MQCHISMLSFLVLAFICFAHLGPSPVKCLQNEYAPEDQDKILGLKHFEQFLSDLEKKIADWTRSFRDMVVDKPNKGRVRRQAVSDPNAPPRKFTDWIVVQDLLEGVKFLRKQISDFIDRSTRFITGDQQIARQATLFSGPYVPIVKELREYMVLLQRRLTVWSVELERVFQRKAPTEPNLLAVHGQ